MTCQCEEQDDKEGSELFYAMTAEQKVEWAHSVWRASRGLRFVKRSEMPPQDIANDPPFNF